MENFYINYSSIKIVYNNLGRLYEIKAADNAVKYINKINNFPVNKVNHSDYTVTKGEYVIYLGKCKQTENIWNGFNKEGYVIKFFDGYSIVRGSSEEYTYCAINKLLYKYIKDDLQNFNELADNNFGEEIKICRNEYVKNIDKFPLVWEYEWKSPNWLHDFNEKTNQFKDVNGRPMVFGHRGDIECYPENSIEGFISAVKRGVDGIELDIWKTIDGIYVLNHSKSLKQTTDWIEKKGKIIDGVIIPESDDITKWTFEQISKLQLRYGNGNYSNESSEISPFKMATLEEALLVVKNRCYLSMDRLNYDLSNGSILVDNKMGLNNPNWEGVYALMKKTKSFTTLYANLGLTVKDTDDLRKILNKEQNVNTPTLFDRTGTHNCVIDWFAEFTCSDFDSLYKQYILNGVHNGKQNEAAGSYLLVNRPSKAIDFLDKYYSPRKNS